MTDFQLKGPPVNDKRKLPDWFDEKTHIASDNGVMERKSGLWLDGDGLPLSGPARAERLKSPSGFATYPGPPRADIAAKRKTTPEKE